MVSLHDGGEIELMVLFLAALVVFLVWAVTLDQKRRGRAETSHDINAAVKRARDQAKGRGGDTGGVASGVVIGLDRRVLPCGCRCGGPTTPFCR
jgi:hypothetical protein